MQQSQIPKTKNDNSIPQHFNNVLGSLLVAIKKLYADHPSLIITIVSLFLLLCYFIIKAINSTFIYSLVVTLLFIFLSICLYLKEKNSLNAIFAFSLGIFTAFTVTWNGPTFSIFFLSFIILIIGIFFIASIRAAANVEEKLTIAASSYISDFETNKKDLKKVQINVTQQGGLLPVDKKWEAILFFAYQKVPEEQMTILIKTLNYMYTMTKLDIDLLLSLLSNIYYVSHTEDDLLKNTEALKLYILKGKTTPSNLVGILNDTLHIAIENDINFLSFTDTMLAYLSHGYAQTSIAEQLSKKFTKKTM